MEFALLAISILLITVVLLQSGKAESDSFVSGGNSSLFANRKERGGELFISRLTLVLGTAFFCICLIMSFI